jgi:hypothetical protein
VRHSNYGIYIENGAATIDRCTLERNSLHAVVVKNADALILNSTLRNGQVVALLCREGANVQAESLTVINNTTGVACDDKALLNITAGAIVANGNGIITANGAAVSIVAVDIARNRIGLVSETEIPKKLLPMVWNNVVDTKVVTGAQMREMLTPPQDVTTVILPSMPKPAPAVNTRFEPGFSALEAPREPTASVIGNIEVGTRYFSPTAVRNTRDDSLIQQSRYPDGLQPEMTIFLQGKRGDADVNFNADLFRNDWVTSNPAGIRKNMFALGMKYADQALLFGDFFESASETSLLGRKMTGLRYAGNFWDMGRGVKRMEFKLAAGETEIPKDSGDHEVDQYNRTVAAGLSIRQQLTYLAQLSFKPTLFSTISVRGIISHDQADKPFMRSVIVDPAAPAPIFAQTGCIDASLILLSGKMELGAEIDLGSHDTIRPADTVTIIDSTTGLSSTTIDTNPEYGTIAWYNPGLARAVPRVFGLLNPDSAGYAATLDIKGEIHDFDLAAAITRIAPNYYSAGNPYLEADRQLLTVHAERQFSERFFAGLHYFWERRSVSHSFAIATQTSDPEDRQTLSYNTTYTLGDRKPVFSLACDALLETGRKYTDYQEIIGIDSLTETGTVSREDTLRFNADSVREVTATLTAEARQMFTNGIDYSLRYRLLRRADMTGYADPTEAGLQDRWQHEVNARFGFKIKRLLQNRTTLRVRFRRENQDSLSGYGLRVSDNCRLTIIPRKLSLLLKGEYDREVEDRFSAESGTWENLYRTMTRADIELKYTLTAKLSAVLSGGYELVDDSNEGGENYDVKIGGFHLTYLF